MSTNENAQATDGAENSTSVGNALGLLDQSKLASLIAGGDILSSGDEVKPAEAANVAVEEGENQTDSESEDASDSNDSDTSDEKSEEAEVSQNDTDEEDHQSDLPRGVQKRISKLAAKKKAAEAEAKQAQSKVAELEAQLKQAKAEPARKPQTSEFSERLQSIDDVDREAQSALDVLMWTEENPDGAVVTLADGSERELTFEDVRAMRQTALRRKEIELPARRKYLEAESQFDGPTVQEYNWWKKPDTTEYQIAQQLIKDFPEIKSRRPDWKHIVGLFVEGISSRQARLGKAAKPVAKVVPKRAPSQPGVVSPAISSQTETSLSNARRQFASDRSQSSLADVLKAMGI